MTDEFGQRYYLLTASGIPYNEESIEESWSNTNQTHRKTFRTPWRSRLGFLTELLGGSAYIGSLFVRFAPARYPDAPWLIAKSADARGIGRLHDGTLQGLYRKGARITATYGQPDAEQPDDPEGGSEIVLATETIDYQSEQAQLAEKAFSFNLTADNANKEFPNDTPLGVTVGTEEIQYVRHLLPFVPTQAIRNANNTINDAPFPPGATNPHPTGTLKFMGASSRRIFTVQGTKAYELSYKFALRTDVTRVAIAAGTDVRPAGDPATWNRTLVMSLKGNPGFHDWIKLLDKNGNPPYRSTDFTQLFLTTG